MTEKNSFVGLALILALVGGCATDRSSMPVEEITFTPRGPLDPDPTDRTVGRLPGGSAGAMLLSLESGWFELTGPAEPGTASLTDAPMWDPFNSEMPPFGVGGGTLDVTVSPEHYTASDGDAFVARFTDDEGTEYLVLSVFSETLVGGEHWQNNVAVIVPLSDFAPDGTVALDGMDRIAVFAAGPDGPEPTVVAVAITGTVTFGEGSTEIDGHLSATVAADFAPATIAEAPGGGEGVPLVPGSYDLVINLVPEVFCGGTMSGHEDSFAGTTLDEVGAADGEVTLSLPTEGTVELAGAAMGAAFGDPVSLDAIANPPDTYVALTDLGVATGPDSTVLAGAYWLIEGRPMAPELIHAALGLAYVAGDGSEGGCDALFYAELRARP